MGELFLEQKCSGGAGKGFLRFKQEMKSNMRTRKKIVCGVLLAAVLGIGGLVAWQWNNISAALSFVRFSQEELEEKLVDNDQVIKDAMQANSSVTVRDVTDEERNALKDGTMTPEELAQSLLQKQENKPESEPEQPAKPQTPSQPKPEKKPEQKPEQSTTPQQPEQKPEEPAQPEQSEGEKKINELIAQVLVLREEFLIKLDNLMAQAKADYLALPPESRTSSNVMKMATGYMARGLAMEKECDARIKTITEQLTQVANEYGGDPTLAETVYNTYVEEKSLKKAWYMAELKKIGVD